jgi:hypothetical protein
VYTKGERPLMHLLPSRPCPTPARDRHRGPGDVAGYGISASGCGRNKHQYWDVPRGQTAVGNTSHEGAWYEPASRARNA